MTFRQQLLDNLTVAVLTGHHGRCHSVIGRLVEDAADHAGGGILCQLRHNQIWGVLVHGVVNHGKAQAGCGHGALHRPGYDRDAGFFLPRALLAHFPLDVFPWYEGDLRGGADLERGQQLLGLQGKIRLHRARKEVFLAPIQGTPVLRGDCCHRLKEHSHDLGRVLLAGTLDQEIKDLESLGLAVPAGVLPLLQFLSQQGAVHVEANVAASHAFEDQAPLPDDRRREVGRTKQPRKGNVGQDLADNLGKKGRVEHGPLLANCQPPPLRVDVWGHPTPGSEILHAELGLAFARQRRGRPEFLDAVLALGGNRAGNNVGGGPSGTRV